MDKRVVLPIAAAIALFTAPLMAAEHEILMVDGGFFPDVTYLNAGDTVTFTNLSGGTESVTALDESWSTSNIQDGGSQVVVVTASTFVEFALDLNAEEVSTASFSFAPAPTE